MVALRDKDLAVRGSLDLSALSPLIKLYLLFGPRRRSRLLLRYHHQIMLSSSPSLASPLLILLSNANCGAQLRRTIVYDLILPQPPSGAVQPSRLYVSEAQTLDHRIVL